MIDSVEYGTLIGGLAQGVIGYTLNFNEQPGTSGQIADLVVKYVERTKGKKVISLEGSFPPLDNMVDIVKAFLSRNYFLRVVLKDNTYLQFAAHCSQVCFKLTSPKWIGFKCSELWYEMDELTPPYLPDEFKKEMILFAWGKNVFDFVKSSPEAWRVNFPVQSIRDIIYRKE